MTARQARRSAGQASTIPSKAAAWYGALAKAVDAIGCEAFFETLSAALQTGFPFQSAVIMEWARDRPPRVLLDQHDPGERDAFDRVYLGGLYLISPFYQAFLNGRDRGILTLADVAPPGFRQSEYYKQFYSRLVQPDMVDVLFPSVHGTTVNISLGRGPHVPQFSRDERVRLLALVPLLEALVGRHQTLLAAQERTTASGTAAPERLHARYVRTLTEFGRPGLTQRESEVVQLLLRGHSAKSIGRELKLSPETVRVHTKHAHAKLQVSSQSELFARFIDLLVAQT